MTAHNADVARIFDRLADLLEIEGAKTSSTPAAGRS
jgi:hypothetical protein